MDNYVAFGCRTTTKAATSMPSSTFSTNWSPDATALFVFPDYSWNQPKILTKHISPKQKETWKKSFSSTANTTLVVSSKKKSTASSMKHAPELPQTTNLLSPSLHLAIFGMHLSTQNCQMTTYTRSHLFYHTRIDCQNIA